MPQPSVDPPAPSGGPLADRSRPRTDPRGRGTGRPGSPTDPRGSLTGPRPRDPQEIARVLLDDVQLLFRKHLELAQQELLEAVDARLEAAVAGAVAGVAGLFALGFLAAAGAHALEAVVAPWLARLLVGVAFLVVAGGAALFGRSRMTSPPMTPERTKQSLREDARWVRARMRR